MWSIEAFETGRETPRGIINYWNVTVFLSTNYELLMPRYSYVFLEFPLYFFISFHAFLMYYQSSPFGILYFPAVPLESWKVFGRQF